MAASNTDTLVAINTDADTCRALVAGRAFRARQAELRDQEQRLANAVARTPKERRDKVQRVYGRQVERARDLANRTGDRYANLIHRLPEDVQERVRRHL